ncbi:MAG TPA: DUF6510 family protein [Nocardioidaceae bacterium]|nr:DUF6510 family protein [Nocardioidaceae bacterium]
MDASSRPGALDGNALAGPLSEVFVAEVTTAVARCRGCGRATVVAELVVFGPDPGLVARCPGCSDVLLRVVRTPERMWLDLGGMASLEVAMS